MKQISIPAKHAPEQDAWGTKECLCEEVFRGLQVPDSRTLRRWRKKGFLKAALVGREYLYHLPSAREALHKLSQESGKE